MTTRRRDKTDWRCPVFLILATLIIGSQALSLRGVRCGQLICNRQNYCSSEKRCSPCTDICNESTHNFDMDLCVEKCQDYIHDLRYVTKGENSGTINDESLRATVQNHQFKLSVIINIMSVTLVLLVIYFAIKFIRFIKGNYKKLSWAWIRKKMQSPKRSPKKTTVEVIDNRKPEGTGNLQTLNALALQSSVNSPRRQPAEDASLDHSYDNMAMNVTPTSQTRPSRI